VRYLLCAWFVLTTPTVVHAQDPLQNPALGHLPLTLLPDTLAYCQLDRETPRPFVGQRQREPSCGEDDHRALGADLGARRSTIC
jgi:hypothetical protein